MSEETRNKTQVVSLLADVEQLIDDWFQTKLPFSFHGSLRWKPQTDLFETENDYRVTMAVPGLEVEDVSVGLERDVLRIRGVRRERCNVKRLYYKMEIPVGPFERRIRVPRNIVADDISVAYEDGLLVIRLPKSSGDRIDVPVD